MALKLIIDTDTVIQRMALQDIAEVRDAVDSVLTSAHVLLQGILDTVFEPVVQKRNVFYLQPGLYPITMPNRMLCCKLSQAFVVPSSVSVAFNLQSRNLLATDPTTLTLGTDYIVDPVRGYVLLELDYIGDWVSITYDAGFTSTNKAPEWLQEAVLAYMPYFLSQPSGGIDVRAMRTMLEVHKTVQEEVGKIVEPYLRNRSFQFSSVTQ